MQRRLAALVIGVATVTLAFALTGGDGSPPSAPRAVETGQTPSDSPTPSAETPSPSPTPSSGPAKPPPPPQAFPGAEGFGAGTRGGRGGRVIEVTNLRDSGSGSFRAAIEAAGPRIVVFRVSGTITLNDDIKVTNPYLTVLGQTAPRGGITLKSNYQTANSGLMDIHTHDVVIRFIRFRSGTYKGRNEGNPITAYEKGAYNIVLDHNSFSWGVNENVTTYSFAHDITISWNIISEALNNAGHPEGPHSRGLFMSGDGNTRNQSAHHNLLAHNDRRNPEINLTGTADFVNNVVYNWGAKAGLASDKYRGVPLNFVGNYYKPGPSSFGKWELEIFHADDKCNRTLRIYPHGNIGPNRPNDSLPQDAVVQPDPCKTILRSPNRAPGVTTTSAARAYDEVLARAGAVFPYRDPVDERVVNDVKSGTGRIINDPSEVGGWPKLPSEPAPADADHDGMPDEWESANGLNPRRNDSAADRDRDGYTNVEEYANELVAHLVPGARAPASASAQSRSNTSPSAPAAAITPTTAQRTRQTANATSAPAKIAAAPTSGTASGSSRTAVTAISPTTAAATPSRKACARGS
jgi:pectate lyase